MEFIEQEQEFIYDPLKQYQLIYKNAHLENSQEYFEVLKDQAQVDVEANHLTVKKIKENQKSLDAVSKKLSTLKTFTVLLVILLIGGLLGIIFGIMQLVEQSMFNNPIWILIISLISFIGSILLLVLVMKPKTKKYLEIKDAIEKKLNDLIKEAYAQMEPLNRLFYEEMRNELFRKTLPQIHLDNLFEASRLDYLVNKFKFAPIDDDNRSTLYVQSGVIFGNPFFVGKELRHRLGTKIYSGSITITWTTTSYVNGKSVTQHHSQVLTATVEKPCPYYHQRGYAVYGNEAAPDLIFHRLDSDAEIMSEKQISKFVDKEYKKLTKKSQKSIAKGDNYTVMASDEFEVLWGAKDRNHEVQFRLLFTPLAQKQLLDLMKDKEVGFGDDFDFIKEKMINYVFPKHLNTFPLQIPDDYFSGYDYEAIKSKFIQYNHDYFKNIYFTLAPFLAIPLYQHQKPQEYIYQSSYESNLSFYEHEKASNAIDIHYLKHPDSNTENILKTRLIAKDIDGDLIQVTSYGYKTTERVEYIRKLGGDGKTHTIPVKWIEYTPVNQTSQVKVQTVPIDEKKSYRDQIAEDIAKLKEKGTISPNLVKLGRLIAYTIK